MHPKCQITVLEGRGRAIELIGVINEGVSEQVRFPSTLS